jgi:hypothetical protein
VFEPGVYRLAKLTASFPNAAWRLPLSAPQFVY